MLSFVGNPRGMLRSKLLSFSLENTTLEGGSYSRFPKNNTDGQVHRCVQVACDGFMVGEFGTIVKCN